MRYQMNETVAIAQSYADITPQADWANSMIRKEEIGWNNKMFVLAEDMPNHIRITKFRIERLQDISDEDCIAEGIQKYPDVHNYMRGFSYIKGAALKFELSTTPREVYANLIDRISCKGTWERNPYVFVYDFELID